jgi:glycosyltransferase involved in cell wall biosynthesis
MESHNKKYNILQILPTLISGGVERGTIEIVKYLKQYGHNPIVISAGGNLVQSLNKNGILHIKLPVNSKNPFTIYKNNKLIAQIIKDHNIELVHTEARISAWSCYFAVKKLKIKFLTTFHGIYKIDNFFQKLYNSIMFKSSKIIAVSNFVKKHIIESYYIEQDKIEVIHMGADPQYFSQDLVTNEQLISCRKKYNIPTDLPVILLPARMTKWKGHDILVKAIEEIRDIECYCLMVGDISKHCEYVASIKDLISRKKLQNKIQIFGSDNDMLPLYALSDIVISTSIEPESFSRTMIESQLMKKLVIATNLGSTLETIIDNKTGYYIPYNDHMALAKKIKFCISILGSAEAAIIQNSARQHVIQNFSIDLMVSKILDLYSKICK